MSYFAELDAEKREQEQEFGHSDGHSAFEEAGDAALSAFAGDEHSLVNESQQTPAQQPLPQNAESTTPRQDKDTSAQNVVEDTNDAARKAHEEAEAKRKAEWEAEQLAKKQREEATLKELQAMSDEEVMKVSMKRVSTETEKLTRRNMKECISEYIQTMCLGDPIFARMAMHPRKSMIHCIWYINRKAQEFVEQELKNNGMRPDGVMGPRNGINGIYGCDVPDDLVYQWAEAYFRDPDAKEDQEEEEKFVPKPYYGKSRSKSTPKPKKEKVKTEPKPKPPAPKPKSVPDGQLMLGDLQEAV